jgi:hypothetical protein
MWGLTSHAKQSSSTLGGQIQILPLYSQSHLYTRLQDGPESIKSVKEAHAAFPPPSPPPGINAPKAYQLLLK